MPPRHLVEGNGAVTANIISTLVNKEKQYMEPVQKNHTAVKGLAKQWDIMQKDLPEILGDDNEMITTFLAEQKQALEDLAAKTVQQRRTVQATVAGFKQVHAQMQTQQLGPDTDYEQVIGQAVENAKKQMMESSNADIHQDKHYRDIMEAMGLIKDQEDDEIALVSQANDGVSLKCPITSMLMEDPVRNKLCGHTYSREGITSHIRTKGFRCRCPVPGCTNTNTVLVADVLETDYDMEQKVRREKRRLEQQSQRIATQATDLVDSDEED